MRPRPAGKPSFSPRPGWNAPPECTAGDSSRNAGARTMHKRTRRRALTRSVLSLMFAAVIGLFVWNVTGCQTQLTPDGKPYTITVAGSRLYVTNKLSGDTNREALWSSATATSTDSRE